MERDYLQITFFYDGIDADQVALYTDSMLYTLTTPLIIGPSLTPSVRIGDSWLTLEFDGRDDEGRVTTRCTIFGPAGDLYVGGGASSGCGAIADDQLLRDLFVSTIDFLLYDAEGTHYSDHEYAWPPEVAEWASENELELQYVKLDIEPYD